MIDDVSLASSFDEPDESIDEFINTSPVLRPESSVGIVFWLATMVVAASVVAVVFLGLPFYYLTYRDAAPRATAGAMKSAAGRTAVVALPPAHPAEAKSAGSKAHGQSGKISAAAAPKKPAVATVPAPGTSPVAAPAAPALHAVAPASAASLPTKTPMPPGKPHLSAAQIADLSAHGDDLLGAGDIVSARLFYERAADAGDGRAALRLGATFDPNFLARAGLHDVSGDAAQALVWYRRARELGAADAERWIKRLEIRTGR